MLSILLLAFGAALALLGAGVYNLILHPLAHIPGPKLAGMTKLYMTFWAYHNGRSIYYQKVRQMHQTYGDIVRIAPNEISLRDPNAINTIYSARSSYSKDPTFYRAMGVSKGMFGAVDNQSHRALRAPWSSYFSKSSISAAYNKIEHHVGVLRETMNQETGRSGIIPLQALLHATTMDIVSDYTLQASFDLLRDIDQAERCTSAIFERARWIWILMASTVFYWPLSQISRVFSKLRVCTTELDRIYELSKDTATRLHEDPETAGWKSRPSGLSKCSTTDDLYSFNIAGAFNTGTITSITLFHVLSNASVRQKLAYELSAISPEDSTLAVLERLPYLTACVMEGLRLGYGPIGRLPRVVPPTGATFGEHKVPPGTVVGVWSFVQHHNPAIWGDDHHMFNPDRWLDKEEYPLCKKESLITFGADGRHCIGRELALATIRLTVAMVTRYFEDFGIHGKFSPEDLDDYFAALIPRGRPQLKLCKCCVSPKGRLNFPRKTDIVA